MTRKLITNQCRYPLLNDHKRQVPRNHRPTTVLPKFIQPLFPYSTFNSVQSECFDLAFNTDENLVISAPTGTGKTVIAEMAIIRSLLINYLNLPNDIFSSDFNSPKDGSIFVPDSSIVNTSNPPLIIYVSPLRSLCQERASIWSKQFKAVRVFENVDILELTSDTQTFFPKKVKHPTIICTTPEKLDLVTRAIKGSYDIKDQARHKRNHKYGESFDQLSLVIFDEAHNLTDSRGSVLEAVISRILFISDQNENMSNETARNAMNGIQITPDLNSNDNPEAAKKIRVIGLSATIENYNDFKQWFRVEHDTVFDESYRSTRIDTRIFGYSQATNKMRSNDWIFESSLTAKVTPIIRQYSAGKPVLIFCCTRKSCEKTAIKLSMDFTLKPNEQLTNETSKGIDLEHSIRDKTLLTTIKHRIGIHTAGLCPSDRMLVEQLFLKREIRFICTTSTLSQGVNLPAYLVIIKGTKHFIDSGLEDYDPSSILQMQGRAGRPQFEKEGICVIMTERENIKKIANIIHHSEPIESSLLTNLEEHLNAEIALGYINSENDALRWIMSTFLFIRIQKNPLHYDLANSRIVVGFLTKKVNQHLKELARHEFIQYENKMISTLPVGSICSRYGVLIQTMIMYNKYRLEPTMKNILLLLSKSYEFINDIIVRQDEKSKLKIMSVQPHLRFLSDHSSSSDEEDNFTVANNAFTADKKVFVLIDTALSQGKIDDWNMAQEFARVKRTAERLLACMLQLMIYKKTFQGSVACATLLKCIKRQMWENSVDRLAQQVKGIGDVFAKKITEGIKLLKRHENDDTPISIEDLRKMSSFQLEKATNHKTGWGVPIAEDIQKIPKYSLTFQKSTDTEIVLTVMNMSNFDPPNQYHQADVFIGMNDHLIDHFLLKQVTAHMNVSFPFIVDTEHFDPSDFVVTIIDSDFVGIDVIQKVTFDGIQFNQNDMDQNINVNVESQNEVTSHYFTKKTNFESSSRPITNSFLAEESHIPHKDKKAITKITSFFQSDQSVKVGKQRIMALCPEIDHCSDSETDEIIWPKEKPKCNEFLLDDDFWNTFEFDEDDK